MLKKHELLRRAYESEKGRPCFCVAESGVVLWANEAAMVALPRLLPNMPVEDALPECFPQGFDAEQVGEEKVLSFPGGDESIKLTRFHVKRNEDFFLAQYEPYDLYHVNRGDSGRDGMTLMTSFVRQKVNRVFDLISESKEDLQVLQADYEQVYPFLSQKLNRHVDWISGAEKDCRALMCFAMQLEEYYRFPTRSELMRVPVEASAFFHSLFHDVQVFTMDLPLEFSYQITPPDEQWEVMLDRERYTVALLGLFRISCVTAAEKEGGSLRVEVQLGNGALLLKIRDNVTDPYQLEKDEVLLPRSGRSVPTPARLAYENLKRLTEFQDGHWLLGSMADQPGYQLQIRLPAAEVGKGILNADPGYTSGPWPGTLSGQRGLIQTMFAQLEDDMR